MKHRRFSEIPRWRWKDIKKIVRLKTKPTEQQPLTNSEKEPKPKLAVVSKFKESHQCANCGSSNFETYGGAAGASCTKCVDCGQPIGP